MVSLKTRVIQRYIRTQLNFNPLHTTDAVSKMRKATALLVNDKTPKGLDRKVEKTETGARYERLSRSHCAKNGKVLLYVHGGAYIAGLQSNYRSLAKDFCDAVEGLEVIMPDYSLAPEAQYPAQLNEVLDIWHDLINNQHHCPEMMIIGGDSAGANLVLALLMRLREEGMQMPKAAFCISAWADMTGSGDSFSENYPNDLMFGEKNGTLTPEIKEKLLNSNIFCFMGDADPKDPHISPVYGEFEGFPPMFFISGGHEMLLDDTRRVIEKLNKAGVSAELEVQPGMFHIYAVFHRFIPQGEISFGKLLQFICRHFQGSRPGDDCRHKEEE